ncbi:hypothetical protein [Streptomyces sp. NPDC058045]|uniref:hypothetical protein n=1 Tax=Streptomyces sp. NPDC058045 TaxID=3346311 RepID=UPI0036E5374D
MRPAQDPPGSSSATPIYDALYAEYRRSFRALPGDRSGEEELVFTGFGTGPYGTGYAGAVPLGTGSGRHHRRPALTAGGGAGGPAGEDAAGRFRRVPGPAAELGPAYQTGSWQSGSWQTGPAGLLPVSLPHAPGAPHPES